MQSNSTLYYTLYTLCVSVCLYIYAHHKLFLFTFESRHPWSGVQGIYTTTGILYNNYKSVQCTCVQCTLYSVQCTCVMYSVQCTCVHCTVYMCTLYIIQCTLYSVQCTLYSVQCTCVQCTVYSVQCTLYSVHMADLIDLGKVVLQCCDICGRGHNVSHD